MISIDDWITSTKVAANGYSEVMQYLPKSAQGKGGTSSQADHSSVKNGARIKKAVNRQCMYFRVVLLKRISDGCLLKDEFSKLIVYSISVDGPIKKDTNTDSGLPAGSTALDSLEKIILGKETLFHPSSAGPWTFMVKCSCTSEELGLKRDVIGSWQTLCSN